MSLLVRLQLLVPSALAVGAIAVSVYVTH
jgi:hypothetical protein